MSVAIAILCALAGVVIGFLAAMQRAKRLEAEAIVSRYNLTGISIPESATHVGAAAFYGCTSLNDFTYPKHLEADYNSWFEW